MLARTLSRPFFSLASLYRHRHRQPLISFLHTHTHAQNRLSFFCGRRGRRDRQGARRRRSYHTTWTTGRTNQIRTGARGSSHDSYESKQQLGPPPLHLEHVVTFNKPSHHDKERQQRGRRSQDAATRRAAFASPASGLSSAHGDSVIERGEWSVQDGRTSKHTPLYSTHALCV